MLCLSDYTQRGFATHERQSSLLRYRRTRFAEDSKTRAPGQWYGITCCSTTLPKSSHIGKHNNGGCISSERVQVLVNCRCFAAWSMRPASTHNSTRHLEVLDAGTCWEKRCLCLCAQLCSLPLQLIPEANYAADLSLRHYGCHNICCAC